MIPSNAALVEEYWEPLLVLPLEQRRVAGREPPSERRSVEQPEYLVESLLHLHHHRAPITATRHTGTQAMDIPPIGILLTDIRAMDTPAIRDTPLILVPQATDTQATRDTPTTPVLRVMDIRATQGIPPIPFPQATDTQATQDIPTTPVLRFMSTQAKREILAIRDLDTRAARHTPPIPVPVTDTSCMATLAIDPRRAGHLGLTILSSLLGKVGPKFGPHGRA
jgi:hypothetical protein